MLRRLDLRGSVDSSTSGSNLGPSSWQAWCEQLPRRQPPLEPPAHVVRCPFDDISKRGDEGLRWHIKRTTGLDFDALRIAPSQCETALRDLSPLVREALEQAYASLLAFHRSHRPEELRYHREGITVRQLFRPVEKVGCFLPDGPVRHPLSVLNMVVPARVAGVDRIAVCIPPDTSPEILSMILAAATLAGVDEVYRLSGTLAIAALVYGTESVAPVDVIVGHGDASVVAAQQQVAGLVGVLSSGSAPAEVAVIVDDATSPDYAAGEIVMAAEHGEGGRVWLITESSGIADEIDEAVNRIVIRLPERQAIESWLDANGIVVFVDNLTRAIDVSNAIGPDLVEIMTVDPEALVSHIRHAGTVLCGAYAPVSIGEYFAGPGSISASVSGHIRGGMSGDLSRGASGDLSPGWGSARFASAVGVRDFFRQQHVVSLDDATFGRLAPHAVALAEAEALDAHVQSIRMRTRR